MKEHPIYYPSLKQAGVVDSGGKGLYFLLEGMLRFINNQPVDIAETVIQPIIDMENDDNESIEPGQDFELVIDFQPDEELNTAQFYDSLSETRNLHSIRRRG